MASSRIRGVTQVALGAAILCVSALISVPFAPVPFTLQSYALFSLLGLLGAKRGGASLLIYLTLGVIGLPVFSGLGSGLGALLGPTGGFLFGFLPAPLLCFLAEKKGSFALATAFVLSMLVCYLTGSLWYYLLFAGGEGYPSVLTVTVLPFLLPDALKLSLSVLTVKRLRGVLHKSQAQSD